MKTLEKGKGLSDIDLIHLVESVILSEPYKPLGKTFLQRSGRIIEYERAGRPSFKKTFFLP